ncbi:Planctomycete cytochrome C [Planctomycetes bacterium CA13]|uniref:Planctomycete cytochrome C n=1 Tax=Novipirellula herctigrandis TaxID=2527986 RepID=A0A5C5Z1V9_9BACT|nr:Planctomycete cytochrome C [Planctomycetes bacterium CA13]
MKTILTLVVLFALSSAVAVAEPSVTDIDFFENSIRPVLVDACYQCHSAEHDTSEGGLRLDSANGLLVGGDSGPAIVPGNPDSSLLIRAIASVDGTLQMPPDGDRLDASTIEQFREWIRRGAADPRNDAKLPPAKDMQAAANHWAFQPLDPAPLIPYSDSAIAIKPIDHFVAVAQKSLGVTPNPFADRRTLLRRVSYDLIGLPPTYQEMVDFENDESPDAYEKIVERLLASTAYGQRWGRLWLDVARYADTKGYLPGGANLRFPFSYTYRDYVIDAFNNDKPYREFLIEQIAADKLGPGDDARLAALGYLTLGRRFLNNQDHIIDDRIDVVTRGMLGLTVACARCHDHKFDPIPTADYYSLHGIFASSREPDESPLLGATPATPSYREFLEAQKKVAEKIASKQQSLVREFIKTERDRHQEYRQAAVDYVALDPSPKLDPFAGERKLNPQWLTRWIAWLATDQVQSGDSSIPDDPSDEEVANWIRRDINEKSAGLKREAESLHWTHPGAPRRAMALVDIDHPRDSRILRRGKRGNEGDVVPRRFLAALSPVSTPRTPFTNGSGRLELAHAIADQPLAARVLVNRVWGWHFGSPMVDTPSDFGVRTESPRLVDALNYLAGSFVRSGGSVKHLHREIVLSATYRQTSDVSDEATMVDPENTTYGHFNRQRLGFEAMRDSMLFFAGVLDTSLGGLPVELTTSPSSNRRTVYGYIDRSNLPGMFRTFDFPNPDATSPKRFQTTVPQQALFMMNSPFVIEQADQIAVRCIESSPEETVVEMYKTIFQRLPSESEKQMGVTFLLGDHPEGKSLYAQTLMLTNEAMFVD